MKSLSICVLLLVAGPMVSTANVDAAKFTVTYSVTFNAITLYEAARLEKVIKEEFGDACFFSIKVAEILTISPDGNIGIGVEFIPEGWIITNDGETDSGINLKDIPWQNMPLDSLPATGTLEFRY